MYMHVLMNALVGLSNIVFDVLTHM